MTPHVQHRLPIVSVFGSSRPKAGDEEYRIAFDVGTALAAAGFTICNGAYGGTMEATARGAKEVGGKTIGVTCEFFGRDANPFIDEAICVKTLSERLMKLIELGDAYIVLRGSTGTLLELAAVWEFINKKVIEKKPIIVVGDFWTPLIRVLNDELSFEGKENATKHVSVAKSPEECLGILTKALAHLK